MRSRFIVVALALLVAGVGTGWAQETTSGSLAGLVLDAQGAPVPGATVTLTSGEGVRSYVTGDDGRFFAPFLTPSTYSVRVELAGFSPVEQPNVVVRLGQRVTLSDVTLKPGGISEVVQVQGAP